MLIAPGMFAQTAQITGSVTDTSGALVQRAHVTVHDLDTNVVTWLETNTGGNYEAAALPPGRYTVLAEASGFQSTEKTGITLFVDTPVRVDFKLQPGGSNQTVTVTDSDLTQENNAEIATEISGKQYLELPLEQVGRIRSPTSFVYLAPGVQGNLQLNGQEYTGATNVIAVHGSNIWNTELLVDGIPGGQTRIIGNYTESSPAVDAMREFKITTTQLPADYGHTGAAVGSFAVKSGTNQWHGSIYEYFRNNALDSNNWLAKHGGNQLAPTHQNEFGATIGGPLSIPHLYNGRDRTFFFFAYGGSRKSGADTFDTAQVPTPQELQGDFSTYSRKIYDPATTAPNPKGTGFVRTQFPSNKITHFDPLAQQLLKLFPSPNQPTGSTVNYGNWDGEVLLNPDTYTAKVDEEIRPNHRVSVTYIRTYIPRLETTSPLPEPLTTGIHQLVGSHTARVAYNWILSSSLLNQLVFGFNRFTNLQNPTADASSYPEAQPLTKITGGLFPSITFTNGYATIGNISSSNQAENDFVYRDALSWTVRKHSIRFGGEFRAAQYNDNNPIQPTSTYGFATLETANPQSTGGTGDGFASFLLGQVETASIAYSSPLHTRKHYTGFFVQDDWKATTKLTVNLGLRYEWSGAPTEKDNRTSIVSLTTPNPGAGNLPGALVFAGPPPVGIGKSNLFPTDYTGIGPRFGFAYQVHPGIVLRGGYGIYYSDILPNTALSQVGFQVATSFSTPNNGVNPAFVFSQGPNVNLPQGPNLSPTAGNGQNQAYYGPHVDAMPRTQQWSLSLQHQLTPNLLLELAYVGVHNTRQVAPNMVNINQVDPKYLALGTLLTESATSSDAKKASIVLPYSGFTGSVAQALRPYPQYTTLTSQAAKVGASEYNGGEAIIRKRTSFGLALNANYTFSKNMGYNNPTLAGNGGVNNSLQNQYNPRAEWSLMEQDVHHALNLYYTYELPFNLKQQPTFASSLASHLANGWAVSGIQRYQSGFPIEITATNNLAIFNSHLRPNLVPGADPLTHISNGKLNPTDPSMDSIFNKAAFTDPVDSFGNLPPSSSNIRNFPVLSESFAVTKHTQLTEHLDWIFYTQFFNAFNRHRFTTIGANADNASFGIPSNVSMPRQIQFGTRFLF
ncbi:TonB-dependent receptor [Granulicella sp. WH15]|uniref:TonB-dependent receptor n=1 Tax=Granulicella sp. WH15 TaxID=2602070 RepID=UPI0013A59F09|nr:TonB-dependent receptor [Granulicella sp. WH15]